MASVVVIGGGVAGLSAGIHAAKNGYDTTVLEMHDLPGGLCTSWSRQGYTFDGCIHWFVGGRPDSGFSKLWNEVGALDGVELVAHDRFVSIRDDAGNELTLWSDLQKLRSEMLAKWPGEAKAIEELVRGCAHASADGGQRPSDTARHDEGVGRREDAAEVRQHLAQGAPLPGPHRRRHRGDLLGPVPAACRHVLDLESRHGRDGDAQHRGLVRHRRRELGRRRLAEVRRGPRAQPQAGGGEIRYGARVERILVEDDAAVGVRLIDGTELRADHVISAADGHATIFDMLEGRYADDKLRRLYDEMERFPAIFQVSLGVDRDLSNEPWSVIQLYDPPLEFTGQPVSSVWAHHYSYDPSMAPEGKSVVTAFLEADYDYWMNLRRDDRERYRAEKAAVAEKVIDQVFERTWPGIRDHIEVVDVATPATYDRYTGNWKGSFEGWLLSPRNAELAGMSGMPRTLPGLSNFVMAGQWVWPGGGLPSGVLTGRWAVQTVCAADGKDFVAT